MFVCASDLPDEAGKLPGREAALLFTRGSNAWAVLRATGGYGVLSGAMWSTMFVAFMLALMTTTTANTLIVNSTTPLVTALLARAVLREPIAPRTPRWARVHTRGSAQESAAD